MLICNGGNQQKWTEECTLGSLVLEGVTPHKKQKFKTGQYFSMVYSNKVTVIDNISIRLTIMSISWY